MEGLKVYKIPDLKGGITYQVQTPDGQWHLTDKDGNFLSQKEEKPNADSSPKGHRRSGHSQNKQYGAKTSLYLEEDLFVMAKHYCADSRLTLTQLVNKSLRYYLKKEKKKNAKEEEQKGIETEE